MVLQAALQDGLSFDPLSLEENGLGPSEVDVRRGQVADALVIAVMVVVLDEGVDLGLEVAR